MLQAQDTQAKRTRALPGVVALIFSALLVAGAVVGGTQAYLMSKTDTYVNTFVSGLPAAGELKVEGKKNLDGRTLVAGEFSFELYETDSDFEVADGADPLQTSVNEGNGAFVFAPMEFTQTGDFYYVVTEKAPAQGEQGFLEHVTYDKTQYRIAVKVTEGNGAYVVDSEIVAYDPEAAAAEAASRAGDASAASGGATANGGGAGADAGGATNGGAGETAGDSEGGAAPDGSGASDPTGPAPENNPAPQSAEYTGTEVEAIVFKNKFDSPDPTVVVNGAVSLSGRDMKVGEFAFVLYEADAEFKVQPGAGPVQTVKNAGAGAESGFGFAALSFSEPGTYRYVISQDASGALGGVTCDDEVYRLEVEVKADGATGMLSAVAKMFVQDAAGNWIEVAVLTPNGQGVIENPDGKPYVAEDPQNDKCAVAYVTFANTYKTESASHGFAGDVDLDGREMAEGEFLFTIETDTEGAPMPGALSDGNDADGGFGFGSVEFDEPGEYHYLVKQDASGALEGVTYDQAVHRVIVTVTDDGNGKLLASVAVWRDGVEVVDGSGVKYLNKYAKPGEGGDVPDGPEGPGSDPDDPGPGGSGDGGKPNVPGQGGTDLEQTGDATMMLFGAFAVVAVCAVAVGAVALVKMRRRS